MIFNIIQEDLRKKNLQGGVRKLLSVQATGWRPKNWRGFWSACIIASHHWSKKSWAHLSPKTNLWCATTLLKQKTGENCGCPRPLKAWVPANQTKHVVVAFFNSLGLIYKHIVPREPLSMPPTTSRFWTSSWNALRKGVQPPVWRSGWQWKDSKCLSTHPLCQTRHGLTFPCSEGLRRSWWASNWTRTAWRELGRCQEGA
jgi:hypothetical protein